jgi:cobalamin biosynthesis protein CbiD
MFVRSIKQKKVVRIKIRFIEINKRRKNDMDNLHGLAIFRSNPRMIPQVRLEGERGIRSGELPGLPQFFLRLI